MATVPKTMPARGMLTAPKFISLYQGKKDRREIRVRRLHKSRQSMVGGPIQKIGGQPAAVFQRLELQETAVGACLDRREARRQGQKRNAINSYQGLLEYQRAAERDPQL